MIPPDFIDELLARTDIVDIVEPRVTLKKTGQNYSGLCPFHNEKSPSFTVSQEKQFYYCFGCQASGSALKFLMEFDRMDFVAAVETLAGKLGMEVPTDGREASTESTKKRKSIHDILEQTATYFREQLKSHAQRDRAVEYLKGRGLSGVIARDFGLGYAPPGWDNLIKALATSNHERELLIESGMVVDNREEDKTYDRFRDRVVFPIRDLRGRTIAFGGRILDDGKPKYLNSPETMVFHKGRELYGLYEARRRNGTLTNLIVVEGYMDVVALAQHGINNSVATLGTATTTEHLDRIFRIVPTVTFCFDGDAAGKKAAWKALQTVLPHLSDGRSARFLYLPDGEDPDSLVRKIGKEEFDDKVAHALTFSDCMFEQLESEVDMQSLDGKAALCKSAMGLIERLPGGVLKQLVIEELASKTGLEPERIVALSPGPQPPPPEPVVRDSHEFETAPALKTRDRPISDSAIQALRLLAHKPELAADFHVSEFDEIGQLRDAAVLSRVGIAILEEDLLSPGLLMEYFQDKPELEELRRLRDQKHLLPQDRWSSELAGHMKFLRAGIEIQSKQQVINPLSSKKPSEMSDAEKQAYRKEFRRRPES